MKYCFFLISWATLISIYSAKDPFDGILQQSTPCFPVVHRCKGKTPLSRAFTPEHQGVGLSEPETLMFLFTPKNPGKAEPLHECGGQLPKGSAFDASAETEVIVHGYFDGVCRTAWMREMAVQLRKRGRYNVLLVDWTWGNVNEFHRAVQNCLLVGDQVGFVLKNIMLQRNITGDQFHIVGHSLGGIIAGAAGEFLRKRGKRFKLRRITGLDPPPSRCPYTDVKDFRRLTYKDAKFVDIIHTSAGTFPFAIGLPEALGHADFYINGGSVQKGCYEYILHSLMKADLNYGVASLIPAVCYHLQAIQYYKVSINPPNDLYLGVECNSYRDFKSGKCRRCCSTQVEKCAVAGMDAEHHFPHQNKHRKKRKYYFDTASVCPFDENYSFSAYKDC